MAKSAEKCPECGQKREDGHNAFCVVGMVDDVAAERDVLRKALTDLCSAAYDVVQRNRQIYMGGTKYTTPTIKKLAEAMFEGHKVLDPSLQASEDK